MHQAFLAMLILERKQVKRAAYTGQAIQHFQAAQEVYTQEKYPARMGKYSNWIAGSLSGARSGGSAAPAHLPAVLRTGNRLQAGSPRQPQQVYAVIPDHPYFTHLILLYRWEADLPLQEGEKLAQRAIAYISCCHL